MALNKSNDRLCDTCRSIFSEASFERWQEVPGKCQQESIHSLRSFSAAVDIGCYICLHLVARCQKLLSEREYYPLSFQLRRPTRDRYQLDFLQQSKSYPFQRFEIREISPQPKYPIAVLGRRSFSRTWTGHEDVALLAHAWLSECRQRHSKCTDETDWKPTRLLDVTDDHVKLIETAHQPASGGYATLSHMWGTIEFPVLTTDTMPRYRAGVELQEFPLTFRQSITMIRRLGIYYLWIDSYCIIQGSNKEAQADWDHESRLMGKVYENGILNIGAGDATGPHQGLFSEREPFAGAPIIQWTPTREQSNTYFQLTRWDEMFVAGFSRELSQCALMRRGWVLQESIMARRMLTFTKKQVYWQCATQGACEQVPYCTYITTHPFWMLMDAGYKKRAGGIEALESANLQRWWTLMLSRYCRCSLTYPEKDLFRAIEGIGRSLQEQRGGIYKYGLFDQTFPSILMWGCRQRRARPVCTPSWHWSSLGPNADMQQASDVSDEMSFRKGGPVAYLFMSNDCKPLPTASSINFWPKLICIGRLINIGGLKGGNVDTNIDGYSVNQNQRKNLVWLPLVATYNLTGNAEVYSAKIHALLLEKMPGGIYRRVGSYSGYERTLATITVTKPHLIIVE
ncbi:heterokaryon incompatibility protein-domain-containing protein [Xylariomycetidae sp. FL0641]|nr:heterokaryon incompatibility protein-domain-containing protein [Xylariomycetidae sp. FL0641]